jgi:hypothetical protein
MKDFIKVGFDVKGPLFDPGLVKEVQEVINTGLVELATIEGSNKVKDQLYPGHGRITANLRNHVGAALVKDNVVRVDAGETLLGKDIVYADGSRVFPRETRDRGLRATRCLRTRRSI